MWKRLRARTHRRRGARAASAAALLLIALLSAIGWNAYALRDDAESLIESLPEVARELKESLRSPRNQPDSNFDRVQKAATQLEQAAIDDDVARSAAGKGVACVQIEKAPFNIKNYVFVGGLRLAEMLAQCIVICTITYFLLASGDAFRRKVVRIAGPTFARRKITVQALDESSRQIQRYLVMQLLTGVAVGVATAAAFWMIRMKHFAVWGVAAAVLNLIPYIGSITLCGVSAVVALTQFGTIEKALLVASISVGLHIVSGYLIAPWLTGRTSRLGAVVDFVRVLAWGWRWGMWRLLLGAPMLMEIKAVCDRVDDLKAFSELLGGGSESAKLAPPACVSEQTSNPDARNMRA